MKSILSSPLIRLSVIILLAIGLIHLISALFFDRRLEYKEISYTSENIPSSLDGYTVTFLTDIHGAPEKKLLAMVDKINARQVDLVLVGGDFSGQKSLSRCMEILAGIKADDGFYGVEGNHDNAASLRSAMAEQEMVLLENTGASLDVGLYIAGTEDLWNRTPDVEAAVAGASETQFVLLLAHNPDTSMRHDLTGVDLTLCGHTHGGEITFLGLWAPALPFVSGFGQRFSGGWSKSAAGTDVFVSHGIGRYSPLRVFARPQVIFLTLRSDGK